MWTEPWFFFMSTSISTYMYISTKAQKIGTTYSHVASFSLLFLPYPCTTWAPTKDTGKAKTNTFFLTITIHCIFADSLSRERDWEKVAFRVRATLCDAAILQCCILLILFSIWRYYGQSPIEHKSFLQNADSTRGITQYTLFQWSCMQI